MSRIAAAAAVLVVGWSATIAVANADPVPPPPPPGPKTSFGNGTFKVGTDITPGVYQSAGPVADGACYWKRVNGDGIVANAFTKKAQIVQIEAGDTAFTSSECQDWQMTDAAPPGKPNPIEVLGQLGSLLGTGGAPAAPGG
jgi:hypothetical protein